MHMTGSDAQDIQARSTVRISRSVSEVYEFYRDFGNLPRFLGDVLAVEPVGPGETRWTVAGPFGARICWTARVTEEDEDSLIRYETTVLQALRTRWEVRFTPLPGRPGTKETEVAESMSLPLGRLGHAALVLMGKNPAEEVSANLRRLKQVMETGAVTDTNHSVPGKFDAHGT